jgi:spore coat protein CotH
MPQPLYPWEAYVEPIEQEADWAQWLDWMGGENLTPNWDSIPGMSSPYQVAIPTTLSWPINLIVA